MKFDKTRWARGLVGETIADKYRLERMIGLGGMGAVFEGQHIEIGRRIAVKVLLPSIVSQPVEVERFRREARSAASVEHEGVVDVLDFGIDAHLGPYLIMEHLDGESLQERLTKRKILSPIEAVAIASDALETLQAVHRQGIVHRDLKPANLFLARIGSVERVKILDFGIARAINPHVLSLTKPGTVMGTPRFMASEQALARNVDHRADIYTIGLILNTCMSGKAPYAALDGLEVLRAVVSFPTTPLSLLCPHLPRALTTVVDMATAVNPEARFQSAEAFRRALHHALERGMPSGRGGTLRMESQRPRPSPGPHDQVAPRVASERPQSSEAPIPVTSETSIPRTRSLRLESSRRRRGGLYWGIGIAGALGLGLITAIFLLGLLE